MYSLYGVDSENGLIKVLSEGILEKINEVLPHYASIEKANVHKIEPRHEDVGKSPTQEQIQDFYEFVDASNTLKEKQDEASDENSDILNMCHSIVSQCWSLISGGNEIVDIVFEDEKVKDAVMNDSFFDDFSGIEYIHRADLDASFMIRYKDLNNTINELRG